MAIVSAETQAAQGAGHSAANVLSVRPPRRYLIYSVLASVLSS